MARLSRVTQKIFGSGAGLNQIAQFGSLAAGAAAFTTDPAAAQSLSNWLTGWFGAVIGGNAPAIEDMNAVLFVYAYQLAYMMQAGVPEWDTGTTYFIGSLVNDGNGVLYKSLTDNNLGNALTSSANWIVLSGGSIRSISGGTVLTVTDRYVLANAAGGAFNITLPTAANASGVLITVKKTDTTLNALTIVGTVDGQTNDTISNPKDAVSYLCDGTGWYRV